jgi:tetratricopeptide (TPR) repeat protein
MRRALLGLLLLTTACNTQNGMLSNTRDGVRAPSGTRHVTEAVDGLLVGHRLMAAHEYQLALDAYTRAVQTHGLNVDVLSAIGSANLKLGRLNQAEKFLKRAVEKEPDFVPAWNNLGVIQINTGQYIQAQASFQRAFALDNGNSEDIRTNLILANRLVKANSAENPENYDFLLVRRGNGRYLLLGQ